MVHTTRQEKALSYLLFEAEMTEGIAALGQNRCPSLTVSGTRIGLLLEIHPNHRANSSVVGCISDTHEG